MDQLAELRERRALTLRELGEMSGVAADTINQIELGHRKPRPSTLRKLARALEVDVEELMRPKAMAPSKSGQPEEKRYRVEIQPTAPTVVTRETLEQHGIPVTDAEVRVLNENLDGLRRGQKTGEPYALVALAGEQVDFERIDLLTTYVLTTPGMLAPEKAEAVRQGVHDTLVAARR
jgi:transcriptional regulator with XRE-family HTH domain